MDVGSICSRISPSRPGRDERSERKRREDVGMTWLCNAEVTLHRLIHSFSLILINTAAVLSCKVIFFSDFKVPPTFHLKSFDFRGCF